MLNKMLLLIAIGMLLVGCGSDNKVEEKLSENEMLSDDANVNTLTFDKKSVVKPFVEVWEEVNKNNESHKTASLTSDQNINNSTEQMASVKGNIVNIEDPNIGQPPKPATTEQPLIKQQEIAPSVEIIKKAKPLAPDQQPGVTLENLPRPVTFGTPAPQNLAPETKTKAKPAAKTQQPKKKALNKTATTNNQPHVKIVDPATANGDLIQHPGNAIVPPPKSIPPELNQQQTSENEITQTYAEIKQLKQELKDLVSQMDSPVDYYDADNEG